MIKNESNAELTVEFARLALSYLSKRMPAPVIFPEKFSGNIKHLLGLVHDCWIPSDRPATRVQDKDTCLKHLLGLVRACRKVQDKDTFSKYIRCAKELQEAGVKFAGKDNAGRKNKKGNNKDGVASIIFDIKFTDAKLEIPVIKIFENTERILRNLMAYEQFIRRGAPTYVCDYVKFMDNLIDSGKDVQLLRHRGIIVNYLGDDDAVAQMFNKLCHYFYMADPSLFYYQDIYKGLNEHCKKQRNVWKATLKKDYFNSPWSLISLIAAAVLLLLTVAQTIFSVLSYDHPQ